MALSFLFPTDTCSICTYEYTSPCLKCDDDNETKLGCEISFGECGHIFHTHCIVAWNQRHITCPFECGKWETEKKGKQKKK